VRWLQSSSVDSYKAVKSTATKQIKKSCARFQKRSACYKKSWATEARAVHQKQRESSQECHSTGAEYTQERSCKGEQWAAQSDFQHSQILVLYVGCAALQYPEDSLQSKTVSSKVLRTEAALSIWPLPECPHHRGNPGFQLPW